MYSYQAYGLDIQSTQALNYLSSILTTTKTRSNLSVVVDLSNQPPRTLTESNDWHCINPSESEVSNSGIKVWRKNSWLKIHYSRDKNSVLTFFLSAEDKRIFSYKPPEIPLSDVESFLIGPILGCLHRLLGNTCLHASVLSYHGHAFALVGAKGAGKSTTSAALLDAGAKLVSDDIAVLNFKDSGVTVEPGYPAVRLLPASLGHYSDDINRWDNVLSVGDKKIVPLPNEQIGWLFDQQTRPLSAVYVLQSRSDHIDSVQIKTLSASQSVIELAPHGYANHVVGNKEKAADFARVSQLVRAVPVKSLTCHNNLQSLPIIASKIFTDFTNETKG